MRVTGHVLFRRTCVLFRLLHDNLHATNLKPLKPSICENHKALLSSKRGYCKKGSFRAPHRSILYNMFWMHGGCRHDRDPCVAAELPREGGNDETTPPLVLLHEHQSNSTSTYPAGRHLVYTGSLRQRRKHISHRRGLPFPGCLSHRHQNLVLRVPNQTPPIHAGPGTGRRRHQHKR